MDFSRTLPRRISLIAALFLICLAVFAQPSVSDAFPGSEKAPDQVVQQMQAGQPQEIIVLFDDAAIQYKAAAERSARRLAHEDDRILAEKAAAYNATKNDVLSTVSAFEVQVIRDYSHLPMAFLRVHTMNGLQSLLNNPKVVAVYENEVFFPVLTQSLPLINQPQTAAAGKTGAGTAVAVLDTGLNYTESVFGTCTGGSTPGDCLSLPAAPAGCKVGCVHDFAPSDGFLDDDGHGTNVSGISSGVAPDAKILGLDVFDGTQAFSSDIIAAINWCITNRTVYNIVAMNMSFGNGSHDTSFCSGSVFASPVTNAKTAGILSSIAAGNDAYTDNNASAQTYVDGISSPGCVPDAVSVGAVYDANTGGWTWGSSPNQCTDSTSAADKITCFSQSATYLTILAPGAFITAGGTTGGTMGGTSQAAPHIAGAIAVLKGTNAYPGDTPNQTINRMTSTGTSITDTRGGMNRAKPRINLLAASTPPAPLTYSISGTITRPSSKGTPEAFLGVTVTLTGGPGGSTTTNASGVYTFSGLSNGSYTVTPTSASYIFSPLNRNVLISNANMTGQNFTGTPGTPPPVTYSISGSVSGLPANTNFTMGITPSGSCTTNASAATYSCPNLANGTYTLTPGGVAGYTFSPSSPNVVVNNANATQNFTAAPIPTYTISGSVTGLPANTSFTMNITPSGSCSTNAAAATYNCPNLPNGTYTLTPGGVAGYTFSPSNPNVVVNNANATQNFTASAVPTYAISGSVTGLPANTNFTMGITPSGSCSTNAAAATYNCPNLANGTYTLTPGGVAGYAFTPANPNVVINNANATQNFTAAPTATYSISGTITTVGGGKGGGTVPLVGITVNLTGGPGGSTTTNASGIYTFSGLTNGSYTVTPTSGSYIFTPVSRNVTINNANMPGQNFTGTPGTPPPATYSISGTITSGGNPLANVAVALTGAATANTATNAQGQYTFSNRANGSYTVTPTLAGYTFSPVSTNVTVNNANVANVNFTGTPIPATYSISGTITTTGKLVMPVAGATVTLTGGSGGSTTTNALGNYTFSGLSNGGYTVTPSQAGYTFTPAFRNVTISGANQPNQNFTRN